MQTLRCIFMKHYSNLFSESTPESLCWVFSHKFDAFSFHYTTDCATLFFPYLNAKE